MSKDVLLEIGAEEIPASFIEPALQALRTGVIEGAAAARLAHGEVREFGTPRRLAIWIRSVAEKTEAVVREVSGPSVKAAFDADGKPTQAAEKFALGQGLTASQLARVATPKGEYVVARVEEKGRAAPQLLAEILSQAVHAIPFKKSMRWGDVDVTFARPVHWIVALFGGEVIPVVLGDVKSGRTTRGHRFLAPEPIEIPEPSAYEGLLENAHVVADIAKRKALLLERIREAAKKAGGQLMEDASLVDQVTHLVELPVPVVGTFEARDLDLPPEVLVQEMKSHQRYFSMVDSAGKLLPKFIAVSNTPVKDEKLSLRGYERVLKARLADGRFFFDEDRKTPLAERVKRLERVVWQGKLGSYAEKVERIGKLAQFLAGKAMAMATPDPVIQRAAYLCKADLVTGMVGEFPELQGVMGREYALASGEPKGVAVAIFDHYLPRTAADALPGHDPGALIGIADRLDSLCGLFAIGKVPSGAADPFALRRACLAIVSIVLDRGYRFSLPEAIAQALDGYGDKIRDDEKAKESTRRLGSPKERTEPLVLDFFRARLKALWSEGHRTDVVEAVLAAGFDDLVAARKRLSALSELVGRPHFTPLAIAFKRVMNIVEKQGKDVKPQVGVQVERFVEEPERKLHAALSHARSGVIESLAKDDYSGALREIAALKPDVDTFFEKVMVMAESKELRENRIRLLNEIGALFRRVADFSKIQAEISG